MAGITQTIASFNQGISEQPDHLKFQGQVRDVVNAIPDVTYGLFKRPGAARVGTAPLASVASGGSWFHYFRDDNEGAYVGQVDSSGALKVWKASGDNAGAAQTIAYGTGGQTAIQNYLATSDPENLQFLTINDTTFVTNRDSSNSNTLIGETGTTFVRPEPHCAMIELLRTENGRQYGINIYDSTSTNNLTSLSRATRVKISSDTLDESDGTGSCPGIGTQVFAVSSKSSYSGTNIVSVRDINGTNIPQGDRHNLIFRITTLGQQGVSPNYSASNNGPGGSNYRCSYNREVVYYMVVKVGL